MSAAEVSVVDRNEHVQSDRAYIDVLNSASEHSSQLHEDIAIVSQSGIWGLINREYSGSEMNFIFTGQQPTADYGTYRRVAKRLGSADIDGGVMIHTHADHDRAGKNGFGSFNFLVIRHDADGEPVLDVEKYTYDLEYNDSDYMYTVAPASLGDIMTMLETLAIESESLLIALGDSEVEAQSKTTIYRGLQEFLTENYHLIRSQAELNGVIQSYMLRELNPSMRTVEIMLSDIIETPSFKLELVDLLKEMPRWIKSYDLALNHVGSTHYAEIASLPSEEAQFADEQGNNYHSLPLWYKFLNGNGRYKREKLHIRTSPDGQITYGIAYKGEFKELFNDTDLYNDDALAIVRDISPAAVTLVDIMRNKLRLPLVHGQTGFYYEAVNEVTRYHLETGQLPADGMVIDPASLESMSPVAARYHKVRHPGTIKRLAQTTIEKLCRNMSDLTVERESTNSAKGESFRQLKIIQTQLGIDKQKIDNPDELIGDLRERLMEQGLVEKRGLMMKSASQLSLIDLAEIVYAVENLEDSVIADVYNAFPRLREVAQQWEEYIQAKKIIASLDGLMSDIGATINATQAHLDRIRSYMVEDTPVLVSAAQRPNTIKAMDRLNRHKIKNR